MLIDRVRAGAEARYKGPLWPTSMVNSLKRNENRRPSLTSKVPKVSFFRRLFSRGTKSSKQPDNPVTTPETHSNSGCTSRSPCSDLGSLSGSDNSPGSPVVVGHDPLWNCTLSSTLQEFTILPENNPRVRGTTSTSSKDACNPDRTRDISFSRDERSPTSQSRHETRLSSDINESEGYISIASGDIDPLELCTSQSSGDTVDDDLLKLIGGEIVEPCENRVVIDIMGQVHKKPPKVCLEEGYPPVPPRAIPTKDPSQKHNFKPARSMTVNRYLNDDVGHDDYQSNDTKQSLHSLVDSINDIDIDTKLPIGTGCVEDRRSQTQPRTTIPDDPIPTAADAQEPDTSVGRPGVPPRRPNLRHDLVQNKRDVTWWIADPPSPVTIRGNNIDEYNEYQLTQFVQGGASHSTEDDTIIPDMTTAHATTQVGDTSNLSNGGASGGNIYISKPVTSVETMIQPLYDNLNLGEEACGNYLLSSKVHENDLHDNMGNACPAASSMCTHPHTLYTDTCSNDGYTDDSSSEVIADVDVFLNLPKSCKMSPPNIQNRDHTGNMVKSEMHIEAVYGTSPIQITPELSSGSQVDTCFESDVCNRAVPAGSLDDTCPGQQGHISKTWCLSSNGNSIHTELSLNNDMPNNHPRLNKQTGKHVDVRPKDTHKLPNTSRKCQDTSSTEHGNEMEEKTKALLDRKQVIEQRLKDITSCRVISGNSKTKTYENQSVSRKMGNQGRERERRSVSTGRDIAKDAPNKNTVNPNTPRIQSVSRKMGNQGRERRSSESTRRDIAGDAPSKNISTSKHHLKTTKTETDDVRNEIVQELKKQLVSSQHSDAKSSSHGKQPTNGRGADNRAKKQANPKQSLKSSNISDHGSNRSKGNNRKQNVIPKEPKGGNRSYEKEQRSTGTVMINSQKVFIEITFPGRITIQQFVRTIKQHVSPTLVFHVESHEVLETGMTVIVSVSSKRKSNLLITEIRIRNAEIHMTAKVVCEPSSIDKVHRIVDEARDFVASRARTPIREHEQKMQDLMTEINTLTQAKNVNLQQCGSVFYQVDACKSKWKELDAQLQEIKAYMEGINQELDALITPDTKVDDARNAINEIKREFGLELNFKFKIALPMYAKKRVIIEHVITNQVSVILGETGSGKSTQLTQFLDQSGFSANGMIVCTQPRKVAAISLAKRVAQETGSQVGRLVGWKTGTRHKVSTETKIVYMTDHTLLNECISDPSLSKYSCIIVDEAHERSIFTDLLLGMIKKIVPSRPELRVIVTSATIDPQVFIDFFHCSDALKVSGRAFPVSVFYDEHLTDDNYLENAVQKAINIHTTKPQGDVLVFLTTPIETEKASDMFCKRYKGQDVVCLQIHGQQQPTDQEKAFQDTPNMERKVVFATNCAETSITIRGVKYVIDTGLAREKKFDAKKSMSILEVGRVSKSSADQRKGRAGRTSPGECYRLYGEEVYDVMESVSTPEILRAHLGQSLLKLMLLGIPDATYFDFVQSPPRDALLAAKCTLEELGAIDSKGLTDLGRKLAKLSIEPKLGKLILECIESNIGFEGVIVAALGTIGYNVFFRGKTDKEKEESDKKKVKMCHDRGDILTYLKVFQEWHEVTERTKNKWCSDNSINAKSMRMTRENANDLLKLLDKELSITVHFEFSSTPDVVEEHLPQILLSCYKSNLAYYSGHQSVGYIPVADMNSMFPVHPGSAMRCLRREPKWIIYEQILHTSQQFALNVTCFDLQEVNIQIHHDVIEGRCVSPVPVDYMGPSVVRQFVWKKYGNPRKTEEALLQVINQYGQSGNVVVDVSKGNCTVYTQKRNHPILSKHINQLIRPMNEKLRKACEEYPMVEGEHVRCLLAAGGKLLGILMPEHSRTLTLTNVPPDSTVESVDNFMSMFGTVETVIEYNNSKVTRKTPISWGKVIFSDHRATSVALAALSDGEDGYTVKSDVRRTHGQYTECRVHWCRRELTGYGFITFETEHQARIELAYHNTVIVRGHMVRILPGKKTADQLFMNRIPKDTTKQEMTDILTSEMTDIKDVALIREKGKPTSNSDLDMYKRRINEHIKAVTGRREDIHIELRKPRDFDFTMNGTIMAEDENLVDVLNRSTPLMIENHLVHFEIQLYRVYYIDREVYAVLQQRLQHTVQNVNTTFADDIFISENPLNHGGIRLTVKSSNRDSFSETVLLLNQVTDGARLELANTQQQRFASSMKGKRAIDQVMRKTRVFVKVDRWRSIITVYGESTGIDDALKSMRKLLQDLNKVKIEEIELAGEGRPFGLMRGLFLKYGVGMEKFIDQCALDDIEVSVRQHMLSVFGTAESVKNARVAVDGVAASLGDIDEQGELTEEDCPVCLCPIDDDFYKTELCGHRYCRSCIDGLILHGIRAKELPLVCARESCAEAFVLQDIYNLMGQGREALHSLVSAATEHLVSVNNKEYQFCPTPDCPVVYRVTRHKHKFMCPNRQCRTVICTACKEKYHEGFSCDMHRGLKGDENYSLKAWIKQSPETRSICPKCGIGLQKDGGCQHIACRCGAHICWRCKKTFSSAPETYDHLRQCGGIF